MNASHVPNIFIALMIVPYENQNAKSSNGNSRITKWTSELLSVKG